MLKKYVLPVPKKLRGYFVNFSRLYAYPEKPEQIENENEFIILDSGAFSLSKQGKQINKEYMLKLNNHYLNCNASNEFPILAVAPDVFLNPFSTMKNYEYWKSQNYCNVCPVLQFSINKIIDYSSIKEQLDFYKEYPNSKIIFLSNPGLFAIEAISQDINRILSLIKSYGYEWVHMLGAGWDAQDIVNWMKVKNLDSIDSIAYYNVRELISWNGMIFQNKIDVAISNAYFANNLIKDGYKNV